jgi:hypothetical protein
MQLPVALVQLDATGDVDTNIDRATSMADLAAAAGAQLGPWALGVIAWAPIR